ncbi:MAG: hypothetical protein AVDCRST_MAG85-1892 [uncultured Solirubrobacteraceae bacterium]|uniref:BioF2-like acetyltransferase domain-containing protein n=1 Tax=uncultured Solirubrobacteraceae bacterium TaxID=1162706 RepID=A0A6J4SRA4_9ACTN|nr:MAG: hypothetical protein AVDCRST_MAG85-1892 [uncultured Solirubrobacteraceae bacterium]
MGSVRSPAPDRFDVTTGAPALDLLDDAWDALAARTPSPFLTGAWLRSWWEQYGSGAPAVAVLRAPDGRLRAGAMFSHSRFGLSAAANDHSPHWGAVSDGPDAAAALWSEIGRLPEPVVTLTALAAGDDEQHARAALQACGRRVHVRQGIESPFLELPSSFDELLAERSANLRSQVRSRQRRMERAGVTQVRTVRGADDLPAALEAFLRVEASGWKAREGTAIATEARAAGLYRSFARQAAERGWLRLHLLELDGVAVAGDLACVLGDTEFLLKTGFDEAHARLSPGLVLRANALRAAIEEGVAAYDFLGGPDAYKLRWTDVVRSRVTVRGFRGARSLPSEAWWRTVRPALVATRDHLPEHLPVASAARDTTA